MESTHTNEVTSRQFDDEVGRRIANDLVSRDVFQSEITRIEAVLGTQIGAVEKSVKERLSSLKAWGIAALVGGQAAAGVLAAIVPHKAANTAIHILHYLT